MVAGQYPKREWRDNPDGQIRTIEEAMEIARKHGAEPGRPGNLHDEAWDVADRMVDKMRGVSPQ